MPVRDLGRYAYEAFMSEPKPMQGGPMIKWEHLPEPNRERWRRAAIAAVDAHLREVRDYVREKLEDA